ncbi:restriction endonuclease [Flagellimonas hymeniacidonis]|uniref:Restriction endonuclease n=1 Tax=Flagellimonas hymeniacidonis TaxID=2603628 RepID=A0A5C8V9V1_9FLAO|nr:restriction endonuclease [Flagellimonas hymeniacidonis]TXN38143.1 restriction endonuclease [Flagellimonas hymeniacidonis]
MITKEPKDWQDLQNKVNLILNDIGLNSNKEVELKTPRGTVEIDVYAIDPKSIDKIKYIIECKNWNKKVPQTVIHSFTTIMNETGGNIGYIISKKGFQKGALEYSNSTNIRLFSYVEFQEHYLMLWYEKSFAKSIYEVSSDLISYTEPINSRRFKYQEKLTEKRAEKFNILLDKYSNFAMMLILIGSNSYESIFSKEKNTFFSIEKIKVTVFDLLKIKLEADNFQDLLMELNVIIEDSISEFNALFGKNIFADKN